MTTAYQEALDMTEQEYMVAEDASADRVEEDGVDWCAFWAEYSTQVME